MRYTKRPDLPWADGDAPRCQAVYEERAPDYAETGKILDNRRWRCQLTAGHDGLHATRAGNRTWPRRYINRAEPTPSVSP